MGKCISYNAAKVVVSWCNSNHKMLMEVIDESYISIEFLLKVWFSAMSM
jgi:hypothetical protein